MSESESEETVILEFTDEDTGDVFDTAELPAADWERFELIADIRGIAPEVAFRRALTNYLDKHDPDTE